MSVLMLLRRVFCVALVGCVAACGIELSGGGVANDRADASGGGRSSGASSSTSSGASSGSSSGDASTVVDAAPDVPKPPPPPQYKWRCVDSAGTAKFDGSAIGSIAATALCVADKPGKCAGIGFRPDSDCGKLGDTIKTCTPLCEVSGNDASYSWDKVCTCGL